MRKSVTASWPAAGRREMLVAERTQARSYCLAAAAIAAGATAVGLSGWNVAAPGWRHGQDWARRDVQQPQHDTAQEQFRDWPVPAGAHNDKICSDLPSDVSDLMRRLGTNVVNDPETRFEPIPRELLNGLLELGLHHILVGVHGESGLGRVVLGHVDHDKRSCPTAAPVTHLSCADRRAGGSLRGLIAV